MTKVEILFNKIAQDTLPVSKGIQWYNSLEKAQQKEAMNQLAFLVSQSSPSLESIQKGITLVPIKATMTPVVIFQKNNLNIALQKILQLPESEWRKAFIVMLGIFKAGDTYRRETWCQGRCSHHWHNLED
jgi:hypothetical protein